MYVAVISIHALREEGDAWTSSPKTVTPISIHALREEGDRDVSEAVKRHKNFYPRPPRGGRLLGVVHVRAQIGISIHALREEGDVVPTRGYNWFR